MNLLVAEKRLIWLLAAGRPARGSQAGIPQLPSLAQPQAAAPAAQRRFQDASPAGREQPARGALRARREPGGEGPARAPARGTPRPQQARRDAPRTHAHGGRSSHARIHRAQAERAQRPGSAPARAPGPGLAEPPPGRVRGELERGVGCAGLGRRWPPDALRAASEWTGCRPGAGRAGPPSEDARAPAGLGRAEPAGCLPSTCTPRAARWRWPPGSGVAGAQPGPARTPAANRGAEKSRVAGWRGWSAGGACRGSGESRGRAGKEGAPGPRQGVPGMRGA